MIDNPQSPSSANTQQSLETSDDVPQQLVAPNLTAVIPPSNTNQSSSNLSTASSISISTDNAEKIIQQSLSPSTSKKQIKRKVETSESSYKTRESAAKRTRRRYLYDEHFLVCTSSIISLIFSCIVRLYIKLLVLTSDLIYCFLL